MNVFRNPQTVHAPLGAYTHQAEITGAPRWLVLSGQIGIRTSGELPDDPIEQLGIALDNLTANLNAVDMELRDLVKLTVYFAGDVDLQLRRRRILDWLGETRPCMTVAQVVALATPQLRVEIDAWACTDDPPRQKETSSRDR
jgi:enamine deaminase RidA (YjgF/YER057c/UK114 family)